jgi:hypothetical protein
MFDCISGELSILYYTTVHQLTFHLDQWMGTGSTSVVSEEMRRVTFDTNKENNWKERIGSQEYLKE